MQGNTFNMWRVISVDNPHRTEGLPTSENEAGSTDYISLTSLLEDLTPEGIGFYIQDLVVIRGERCYREDFVLEGGLNNHGWSVIKVFNPVQGVRPRSPLAMSDHRPITGVLLD